MKKILTFFGIICLVVLSINIAVEAGTATMTVTKIKYTLNGVQSGEITLGTPVVITIYADDSAKAPVKIYDFPNEIEGTITSVDMYTIFTNHEGWWTTWSGDLAKIPITVTNNTQEIYVGAIWPQKGDPTVVNPGTI